MWTAGGELVRVVKLGVIVSFILTACLCLAATKSVTLEVVAMGCPMEKKLTLIAGAVNVKVARIERFANSIEIVSANTVCKSAAWRLAAWTKQKGSERRMWTAGAQSVCPVRIQSLAKSIATAFRNSAQMMFAKVQVAVTGSKTGPSRISIVVAVVHKSVSLARNA